MAPDPRQCAPYAAQDARSGVRSSADPRKVQFVIVRMTPAQHAACLARARARGISLSGYLRRCALDEQWVAEALQSPLPPAYKVPVAAHALAVRAAVEHIIDPAGTIRQDGSLHRTYWDGTE